MGHHSKNIGVSVLIQDFAGAFACVGGIAIVYAGHGSPWVVEVGRFFVEHYPAENAGATACAALQKSVDGTRASSAERGEIDGAQISSRMSQNAAALLFDLCTVGIR
jgi:hypothetical protein